MENIKLNKKIILCIAAVVIAAAAVCVFMTAGFKSPSLKSLSSDEDSLNAARKEIERLANEEYTIKLELLDIYIDEAETQNIINRYKGSELSRSRGWTGEALDDMKAVKVYYYAEYDHTMTFRDDGYTEQYFYVMTDEAANERAVAEYSSPNIHEQEKSTADVPCL